MFFRRAVQYCRAFFISIGDYFAIFHLSKCLRNLHQGIKSYATEVIQILNNGYSLFITTFLIRLHSRIPPIHDIFYTPLFTPIKK